MIRCNLLELYPVYTFIKFTLIFSVKKYEIFNNCSFFVDTFWSLKFLEFKIIAQLIITFVL